MKFTIKQYQSRFRLKFFENYHIFRTRFNKIWARFVEKGHERMTVMFIPHNEKKIFNFQISKFTISFFFLLFIIIIVTSSYAMIRNSAVKREEQRLLSSYNDIRAHLLQFERYTNSIDELMEEIKPGIQDLYEITSGAVGADEIWAGEGAAGPAENTERLVQKMPAEVHTLRKLQGSMERTTTVLRTVKNFIKERNDVVINTPSLIPAPGHITSLYGWRRDPFGFGRDFHTGIDIASSSGTKIVATAPGTVVSAGWGGGLGNSVRIQHKYGYESVYGHCSAVLVGAGTQVRRGDVVALVGNTGHATGNHCHYEIRLGNQHINPYPYMSRVW